MRLATSPSATDRIDGEPVMVETVRVREAAL